ncbi:MAG: PAS domain-containing protein [Burkholderiales bacterium]|nr:PAS domain-containing protein [Burkholderiales bacterium]
MTPFPGLDLLATAVLLLDDDLSILYANASAEILFELSQKHLIGHSFPSLFSELGELGNAVGKARSDHASYIEHDLELLTTSGLTLHLMCSVTPVEYKMARILLEFQKIDQQLKIAREERLMDQSQANRALIRNLAHEIRNPLGGIRGAAQLLESELGGARHLVEYTQVIIKEADRLRSLLDRLLTPSRPPQFGEVNIHEVLERVRSLILAEFPEGIAVARDYDTSLPSLIGDREQLIQAVLNIARNAAQAMHGKGMIVLKTRIARQVTIAKKRFRLAISMQIIDNGPGVPGSIKDRIFDPLVSGREGGHGVGLTLAQTFVNQHNGMIECESAPGRTCFNILLPLNESGT